MMGGMIGYLQLVEKSEEIGRFGGHDCGYLKRMVFGNNSIDGTKRPVVARKASSQ
jgi:hypothetical protein